MPKVYLTERDKIKEHYRKKDETLRALVAARLETLQMTRLELANKMGHQNRDTLHRRLWSARLLSVEDLRNIGDILGIPREQLLDCV